VELKQWDAAMEAAHRVYGILCGIIKVERVAWDLWKVTIGGLGDAPDWKAVKAEAATGPAAVAEACLAVAKLGALAPKSSKVVT
jgi:hypothetical protein